MADENKNKKRSILESYYGRLDPEQEKEYEEERKKMNFGEKIIDNFRKSCSDEWRTKVLFRKDLGVRDKFYLLLSSPGYLLPSEAVKLMFSDDPEVRKLQRKTTITSDKNFNDPDDELGFGAQMRKALQEGTDKPLDEVCKKGIPKYIYEPHVRYKRIENPDYKRRRNYSIAGILTGTGLLATGLASFNYALAYAGAALTLTSLGYQSGNWVKKRKIDQSFEKLRLSLSELEKKVKGPVQKAVKEPKDEGLYQSLKHWITDYMFKKSPELEEKVKEPNDDALYVRRLYRAFPPRNMSAQAYGWRRVPFHYADITKSNSHWHSGWGEFGTVLTGLFASLGGLLYAGAGNGDPIMAATMLTLAGVTGITTLGHYVGHIFGKKNANPDYRKV